MNDSFIAKSMFDVLATKDRGLADRFLAIQKRALTDWIPLMRVDMGSHSGLVHLINVGRNVDKLIPDDKKGELSGGEIFLLLSAILFHDIGRILAEDHPSRLCLGPLFEKYYKDGSLSIDHTLPCMKREWDHYKISEDIILEIGQEQGLPDAMAVKYCALLAYCHGLSKPPRTEQNTFVSADYEKCPMGANCPKKEQPQSAFRNTSIEPHGPVRIPLLAAVLRIADETENHWTRAISDPWLEHLRKNKANLFKAFRRRVEDVEFSPAGECIVMHLEAVPKENDDDLTRFADVARKIEEILKHWGPELRPLGLDYSRVFYETGGKLWRIETDLVIQSPMTTVMRKGKTSTQDMAMKKDVPTSEDLVQDDLRIKDLHNALVRLSEITMGYQDFTLAAVEAEAGRPLNDRDKWLIERMADWVPWAISVDPVRQRVRVHIKSGTDDADGSKLDSKKVLRKMSKELIGRARGK
jgi:hypothetical protein